MARIESTREYRVKNTRTGKFIKITEEIGFMVAEVEEPIDATKFLDIVEAARVNNMGPDYILLDYKMEELSEHYMIISGAKEDMPALWLPATSTVPCEEIENLVYILDVMNKIGLYDRDFRIHNLSEKLHGRNHIISYLEEDYEERERYLEDMDIYILDSYFSEFWVHSLLEIEMRESEDLEDEMKWD